MRTKRVHVIGGLPRSGTTLLYELLTSCFRIDGRVPHEKNLLSPYAYNHNIYCTKSLGEASTARTLLRWDPLLWIVCIIRDPRDAVCSVSHRRKPGQYFANLGIWNCEYPEIKKMRRHPRYVELRYEDLVHEPDAIQRYLYSRLPFLEKTHNFSEYPKCANIPEESLPALSSIRPISPSGIGSWKRHKQHLSKQIATYGDISDDLIELGYEKDRSWLIDLAMEQGNENIQLSVRRPPLRTCRALSRPERYIRYSLYWLCKIPLLGSVLVRINEKRKHFLQPRKT